MKRFQRMVIAAAALALSSPVLAGRDASQLAQQERAAKQLRAEHGLAGPAGVAGKPGPGTRPTRNTGHPSERVRW